MAVSQQRRMQATRGGRQFCHEMPRVSTAIPLRNSFVTSDYCILTAHLVTIAQEELPIHQRQGPPSFGPTHFTLEDDAGPGGAPCLEGINEVPLESALR